MPTPPSPEPLNLLDFLDEIGSTFHVISLANLLGERAEKICFVPDKRLINTWKKNLGTIRQTCEKNLTTLKIQLDALDIASPHFLNSFERAGSRVGAMLLKQIQGLQEHMDHAWKSKMPGNALFPVLEILFREGEILRFQQVLNTRCKQMTKPLSAMLSDLKKELHLPEASKQTILKTYRERYTLETGQLLQPLEHLLNTILSFYERKWSLLLAPENGRKD